MEVLKGKLKFSSGREISCYGEKVSLDIGVTGVDGRLYYGSDGPLSTMRDPWIDKDDPGEALTHDECLELAEHMIRSWTEYRDSLRSNVRPCGWKRRGGDLRGVSYAPINDDDEPLYDQGALDAAVAAERERCLSLCRRVADEKRNSADAQAAYDHPKK